MFNLFKRKPVPVQDIPEVQDDAYLKARARLLKHETYNGTVKAPKLAYEQVKAAKCAVFQAGERL